MEIERLDLQASIDLLASALTTLMHAAPVLGAGSPIDMAADRDATIAVLGVLTAGLAAGRA